MVTVSEAARTREGASVAGCLVEVKAVEEKEEEWWRRCREARSIETAEERRRGTALRSRAAIEEDGRIEEEGCSVSTGEALAAVR